ncbi:uncharacterized protein Z519_12127 [Cladophialophora bantiana CBS 173.52]|uniref:PH domain-containing protein n=1 Tax=Cladophialophora bantiana (strain ATCC 10958 / CBS 173.52 / CDC B-1940 / NIH 8579) TaxID=1442370 RepID=A0A0D2HS69_CLAB1|nr:uncharacterized protein Z519_12127 [Cladophialophora bantiana CBS 173.52]KIW87224.1 hypothetical protein Z519_12127 [Cladophialophora bantiana CBS 173.52]
MSTSRVMPIGTAASPYDFDALDPDSYTAHRLKHAFPEHLHLTSRRFFIGPIPEGWLNSHRKEWYRRRIQLSTYSSRRVSFRAATDQDPHHRTWTSLEGPSTAARVSFSFPQPEDVLDRDSRADETTDAEEEDQEEDEVLVEPRDIEPVSTNDVPRIRRIDGENEQGDRVLKSPPVPTDRGTDGASDNAKPRPSALKSPKPESYTTAHENPFGDSEAATPVVNPQCSEHDTDRAESVEQRFKRSSVQPSASTEDNVETNSRTALLGGDRSKPDAKSLRRHEPAPLDDDQTYHLGRTSTGVRFKVSEGVQRGQQKMVNKAIRVQDRVVNRRLRRNTLREGTVVKMERMLVRVDTSLQQVPEDFDENESIKVETRILEKWREFMVVARKSKKQDVDDYRLQIYKTRVIPEIDDESTKKKPKHEIRLDPKTTRVNLYSSLDKTVVIWHPYRKGTRIIVMRPRSQAHSVEWYTFLRDALGWERPSTLQVNVPDLDVTLRLERPFEGLEAAGVDAADEATALARTVAAEKAVAGKIISECIAMLERDPEWSNVLNVWSETAKMGLAWKRYDRLEWVYGANEQKMYGSMAMARSHDLELRPKEHYPTSTYGRKGNHHEEPPPIEGFLIRLTSQKGVHKRMGKAFFKRLYFSTHNQFLMFSRPAKATPPHPPRLATNDGSTVPSAQEIVEKTPLMYGIEPYKLSNGHISWLSSGNRMTLQSRDRDAVEEARRNVANILEADGYIDMCNIRHVRTIRWGASPVDEVLETGSGSDVDFHQEVADTRHEDGSTQEIDDDRVFELVLGNGLVVRLQAYSKQTRHEWVQRMKDLVKYWKLRTAAEMDTFKAIRKANLEQLNVDEEMEAIIGQFAKKWEVSRSEASPELYNMCAIGSCRSITISGSLYLKTRRRATFHRCQVILTGGKLLIFQSALRKRTGEQIRFIHQEKQQDVDLKDCYVYSGLIVDDDLLYQNRTFDANHAGMASLPRVYLEDGWTSADVDVMTCFVVWMNRRKGWFKTSRSREAANDSGEDSGRPRGCTRARLRRVGQLGVPGRGMVFKCRSRAERDHWVLNIASEIERVVEHEVEELGDEGEFRFDK